MRVHPQIADYQPFQLEWGLTVYGIGCYTRTGDYFFWPDVDNMSEAEYNKWRRDLVIKGYDIPEGYKDCYKRRKNEGPEIY